MSKQLTPNGDLVVIYHNGKSHLENKSKHVFFVQKANQSSIRLWMGSFWFQKGLISCIIIQAEGCFQFRNPPHGSGGHTTNGKTPLMSGVHAFVSNCDLAVINWWETSTMELHRVSNSSHYFYLLLPQLNISKNRAATTVFGRMLRLFSKMKWLQDVPFCIAQEQNNQLLPPPELTVVRGTQSCGTTERSEANITALNSLRLMTPWTTGRRWIEDCRWGIQGSYSCGSLSWSKVVLKSNILLPF